MSPTRHERPSLLGRGLPLLALTIGSLGVWGCGPAGDSGDLGDPVTASTVVGQWTLIVADYKFPNTPVYSTTLSIDEAAVITGVCDDGSGQFNGTLRADDGILWSGQVACALTAGQEYPRIVFYSGNLVPDSNESMSGEGSAATQEAPGGPLTSVVIVLSATRKQ